MQRNSKIMIHLTRLVVFLINRLGETYDSTNVNMITSGSGTFIYE